MSARLTPAEALLTLPRSPQADARRAAWRQAITALGQQLRVTGPPPLDGVTPEALVGATRIALDTGLCDDLDWIGEGQAAVALYELSASLPPGQERRDLGRRVFARLYEGSASAFAAVAARMALTSARPLEPVTMRARVSLLFELPVGSATRADPLALALLQRADSFRRWVELPSRGALPARRRAAKLIEHAAREAIFRMQQGDSLPVRVLSTEPVHGVMLRLLADREPVVWRHAAVARGLLATVLPRVRGDVEQALDPSGSPGTWRRAAVSLVSMLVAEPEEGLASCVRLLSSEIVQRDPGVAGTMLWGFPRVIEAEPEAAEELLEKLVATRRVDVAENTATLLREADGSRFVYRAISLVRRTYREELTRLPEAPRCVLSQALRSIDLLESESDSIHSRLRTALRAYEQDGARAAHVGALAAAGAALAATATLHQLRDAGDEMVELLQHMDDLDYSVLESSRLADLMLLSRKPGEAVARVPELEQIYHQVGVWALRGDWEVLPTHPRTRLLYMQRRMRMLLHLVDLDTALHTDGAAEGRVRERVLDIIGKLLPRVAQRPDGSIHRILCATLARSFDAAVREGVADPSDLWLQAVGNIHEPESILAITEGSTNPEVAGPLTAYAAFLGGESRREEDDEPGTEPPPALSPDLRQAQQVMTLSRGLGAGTTYRCESLRQVLLRVGRSLEAIARARDLRSLVESGAANPVEELHEAAVDYRQLADGAKRRLLPSREGSLHDIEVSTDAPRLGSLIERSVAGVPANEQQFRYSVRDLASRFPDPLGVAVESVVSRLQALPVDAPPSSQPPVALSQRSPLPDWLLPRRTIGAFYVVRALGSGGVSSVFVVRRLEERNDTRAETFALKVPVFDPTTARSISEQEFLQLFREEAGALLALPQHRNLAGFVTFDMAARPRPILVMELIRGQGLDRLIRGRALTSAHAFSYLDGILAGLEAMHGAGLGHLDLKPSNVILRDDETPVLVDFGLSGRQLRPGCGTLEYTAPEVLGVVPEGHHAEPRATDIYAFACTAFELLTGELLFDAVDETRLMGQHVAHDGWPQKLALWAQDSSARELTTLLAACLRRDPRHRPTASALRKALRKASITLDSGLWPFRLPRSP